MAQPLVSIVVDTYNHERYIERAIVSALEQDFPGEQMEILVVDDGSTDRTPEIVRKFEPRVRLVRKENGGQASAFNTGIREASGEVVAFLDGDDWFLSGKIAAVMEALEQHPEAAVVGHARYDFEEQENQYRLPPEVTVPDLRDRTLLRAVTVEKAREAFAAWPFLFTSAVTARKAFLQQIGPIPNALTFCADVVISVAAMAEGVLLLKQPLFCYRIHANNLCSVAAEDTARTGRRLQMSELAFELALPVLFRMGVSRDVARVLVSPPWMLGVNRHSLSMFGGSRMKAFRTEMGSFRSQFQNPSLLYRLFKYLIVAPATLLVPPRHFYRMRQMYARWNLARIREKFAKSSTVPKWQDPISPS